ncbi:MAG: hypothetical protein KDB79_12390 [Acidobacteria bacterium]|nr:hypothetical protein [Acidobacteriota bacterium]
MKIRALKLNKSNSYVATFVTILVLFCASVNAQEIVDKTVATVNDGVRTELITYSDLLWQLALVPNAPIDPADSDDLNRALQVIIRQRLIALEARRLPRERPQKEEIDAEIKRILDQFQSPSLFIQRLNKVGFDSIDDENFQRIIADRVAIEKYVDFRFRSFVVITQDDELNYYLNDFTPDFRRQNPGLLLPPLDQVRERIIEILTERRVEGDIETFLDNARDRSEIIILNEV